MERKEHGLSRNAGSGFQPPARNRDQDRDSSRDGYPSTSSYSNPNSWRDRNERGGRERERERERAWGEDSERGRESFGGGGGGGGGDGDRKRPFGHPDNRDDRGSGDRQQCKHLRLILSFFICSSIRPPPKRLFLAPATFRPLISREFFLSSSLLPSLDYHAEVVAFHACVSVLAVTPPPLSNRYLYVSPHVHPMLLFPMKPKKETRALTHSRHLRNPVLFSRPRQTLKSELPMNQMIP